MKTSSSIVLATLVALFAVSSTASAQNSVLVPTPDTHYSVTTPQSASMIREGKSLVVSGSIIAGLSLVPITVGSYVALTSTHYETTYVNNTKIYSPVYFAQDQYFHGLIATGVGVGMLITGTIITTVGAFKWNYGAHGNRTMQLSMTANGVVLNF